MVSVCIAVIATLLATACVSSNGNAIRCSSSTNVDLSSTPLTVYGMAGGRVILRAANRANYHVIWGVKTKQSSVETTYTKGDKSEKLAVSGNYRFVIKALDSFPDGLRARFRLYIVGNVSARLLYESQWAVVRAGSPPDIRWNNGPRENVTVREGELLPMICANFTGVPQVNVNLTRYRAGASGVEVISGDWYTYDGAAGCVRFGAVGRNGSGLYALTASNCFGSDSITLEVTVQSKPKIKIRHLASGSNSQNVRAALESDVVVNYTISGYPPPTVKWYHNGAEIVSSQRVFSSRTHLVIRRASGFDEGVYEIVATNFLGTVRQSVSLTIADSMPTFQTPTVQQAKYQYTVNVSDANSTSTLIAVGSSSDDSEGAMLPIAISISLAVAIVIIVVVVAILCYRKRRKHSVNNHRVNTAMNGQRQKYTYDSSKGQHVEMKDVKPTEGSTRPTENVVTQQESRPPIPKKPKGLSDCIPPTERLSRNNRTELQMSSTAAVQAAS